MDTAIETNRRHRVAAIVPVYNEQETLTDVLTVLRRTPEVDEILVVSDGSTDETPRIARSMGVRLLELPDNGGKGRAMAAGVRATDATLLLFVDGDILNLSEYLLGQLVGPVAAGEAAMCVGVRHRGFLLNAVHRTWGPLLSGIRCLRREVFEAVPAPFLQGYRVETALNWYCRRLGGRITTLVLHGLRHRVKEQKRGLSIGLRHRVEMFTAVFLAWLTLALRRPRVRPARRPRPPLPAPVAE